MPTTSAKRLYEIMLLLACLLYYLPAHAQRGVSDQGVWLNVYIEVDNYIHYTTEVLLSSI